MNFKMMREMITDTMISDFSIVLEDALHEYIAKRSDVIGYIEGKMPNALGPVKLIEKQIIERRIQLAKTLLQYVGMDG